MLTPVKGGGYVAVATHVGGKKGWADWTKNTNLPAGWQASADTVQPPTGRYIVLVLAIGATPSDIRVAGTDIPSTNPLTMTVADFNGRRGLSVWVESDSAGQIVAAFIPA